MFSHYSVHIPTKLKVYNAVVITSITYGCESWTLYRRHIKKLENVHSLYQEYVGKIMSRTLKSWIVLNPPTWIPFSSSLDGRGMSSACRNIASLDVCCMVNSSMAKDTRVELRSTTRTASKAICTGARSSQRTSRNMPETDHTVEPWSSRPLPDLRKSGVRLFRARNSGHSAAPAVTTNFQCPYCQRLFASKLGLQSPPSSSVTC